MEYRLRRHDGQYRWFLVRALPRRDEAGTITMWVGCGTDIHDQKQLVQELLQANEEQALLSEQAYQANRLAQSQQQTFYNLFQQAPALITILRGPQFVFEFVNPMYQQLFPDRQLLGRPVAEALPEAAEQGFVGLLEGVYTTGQTFQGNEVLLQVNQADGTVQDVYVNFTYQAFEENGAIVGISVFAFDVTELVLARKKLEDLTNNSSAR